MSARTSDDAPKRCLSAAFVAPIAGPLIPDGAVVFRGGTIVDVGPFRRVRAAHPSAELEQLGQVVLLPGLVNPHVHLELSHAACGESPGGTFADWILSVRERSRIDLANRVAAVAEAVRAGVEQSLRFGVTTVGDITQHADVSRATLAGLPLRVVSYGEVLGLGKLRPRFDQLLDRALDETHTSDRVRPGLTPHAPYTVDRPGFERCVHLAADRNLPIATHLAETPDERDFLVHHSGPFRRVWESLEMWDDAVETFAGGPIEMAAAFGLLRSRALLAHVNYCADDELDLLARGNASVVYCPRTHRYFGHPPHRWRDMLARGINVALGTDSCASSPNLNLLDDARLAHEQAPQVPVETLVEMITLRAARAIEMDRIVGSLEPGKRADLVAFPAAGADPLREVLERDDYSPAEVWIDGLIVGAPHARLINPADRPPASPG